MPREVGLPPLTPGPCAMTETFLFAFPRLSVRSVRFCLFGMDDAFIRYDGIRRATPSDIPGITEITAPLEENG